MDGETGQTLIGYARVPTADQDLTLQTDALTKPGYAQVFTGKASAGKALRMALVVPA